jgi:hypothetical protein
MTRSQGFVKDCESLLVNGLSLGIPPLSEIIFRQIAKVLRDIRMIGPHGLF